MNFIKKYVEFVDPMTEAPKRFHEYMGYVILSLAVGRRAYFTGAGSFAMAPNLWMIFVGPSSITKKSTTLNIGIRHILSAAIPDQELRYQSDGSRESLIESICEQPLGLLTHSEFGSLMSWLDRDYNAGMLKFLTEIFDQPDKIIRKVGTRDKAKTYVIRNPFMNIATCTTIDWMNTHIKENEIAGGFLPRFNIIASAASDKVIPITPDPDQDLIKEMVWEIERIRGIDYGEMNYSEDALAIYIDWYHETRDMIKNADSLLIPFIDRRSIDTHKFAMLNCIMRGRVEKNIIQVEDISQAILSVRQILEDTNEIVGEKLALNPFQVNRQKIFNLVKTLSNGNGGAQHSTVLHKSKLKSRDFAEVMQTLIEEKMVEADQKGAGKHLTAYYRMVS